MLKGPVSSPCTGPAHRQDAQTKNASASEPPRPLQCPYCCRYRSHLKAASSGVSSGWFCFLLRFCQRDPGPFFLCRNFLLSRGQLSEPTCGGPLSGDFPRKVRSLGAAPPGKRANRYGGGRQVALLPLPIRWYSLCVCKCVCACVAQQERSTQSEPRDS